MVNVPITFRFPLTCFALAAHLVFPFNSNRHLYYLYMSSLTILRNGVVLT